MRGSSRGGIYLRSLNGYPAKRHALGRLDEHAREQQPERCSVIDHQDRAGLAVPGTSGDPTQLYEGPTEWCAEMAGLPIPRRSVRDRLARRPMVPRSPLSADIAHIAFVLGVDGGTRRVVRQPGTANAAASVGVDAARPRRSSAGDFRPALPTFGTCSSFRRWPLDRPLRSRRCHGRASQAVDPAQDCGE